MRRPLQNDRIEGREGTGEQQNNYANVTRLPHPDPHRLSLFSSTWVRMTVAIPSIQSAVTCKGTGQSAEWKAYRTRAWNTDYEQAARHSKRSQSHVISRIMPVITGSDGSRENHMWSRLAPCSDMAAYAILFWVCVSGVLPQGTRRVSGVLYNRKAGQIRFCEDSTASICRTSSIH